MGEIHHRAFGQLFSDAIFFERLANNEKDPATCSRFARSATLLSALSLECAANCCLKQFSANKKLLDDIDKLSFLSKFDLFAHLGFDKGIDYGRSEVQKITELKQVRDSIVHAKVTTSELGVSDENHRHYSVGSDDLSFSIKPKRATGIVSNYQLLNHKDCFSALKSLVEFCNYYFIELLAMDKGLVFGLLNDNVIGLHEPYTSYPQELFSEQKYLISVGINPVFWVSEP